MRLEPIPGALRRQRPDASARLVPPARLVLPAMLALALLGVACSEPSEGSGELRAWGHVEATRVRVGAEVAGRVVELSVDEGDRVEAGQVIARTDPEDLRHAIREARGERRRAAAQLELLVAGPRKEDVAEARALVAQREAELAAAERDLRRRADLLASRAGTEAERDDALARRDAAAARLAAARQRLAALVAGFRKEEIEAARAHVEALDARVTRLESQLDDTVLRSPVAGVVTEKPAEVGEVLSPGAVVVVVTDLDDAWLRAWVGEPELGRLRIGMPATVRSDGGEERAGRLTFVASEAEFTPKNVQTEDQRLDLAYRIKVAIENEGGVFKPGMPAVALLLVPEDGRGE